MRMDHFKELTNNKIKEVRVKLSDRIAELSRFNKDITDRLNNYFKKMLSIKSDSDTNFQKIITQNEKTVSNSRNIECEFNYLLDFVEAMASIVVMEHLLDSQGEVDRVANVRRKKQIAEQKAAEKDSVVVHARDLSASKALLGSVSRLSLPAKMSRPGLKGKSPSRRLLNICSAQEQSPRSNQSSDFVDPDDIVAAIDTVTKVPFRGTEYERSTLLQIQNSFFLDEWKNAISKIDHYKKRHPNINQFLNGVAALMRKAAGADITEVDEDMESINTIHEGAQHDLLTEINLLKKARLNQVDKRSQSVLMKL